MEKSHFRISIKNNWLFLLVPCFAMATKTNINPSLFLSFLFFYPPRSEFCLLIFLPTVFRVCVYSRQSRGVEDTETRGERASINVECSIKETRNWIDAVLSLAMLHVAAAPVYSETAIIFLTLAIPAAACTFDINIEKLEDLFFNLDSTFFSRFPSLSGFLTAAPEISVIWNDRGSFPNRARDIVLGDSSNLRAPVYSRIKTLKCSCIFRRFSQGLAKVEFFVYLFIFFFFVFLLHNHRQKTERDPGRGKIFTLFYE